MSDFELPHADDVNYWKSSTSSPDSWLDKAVREIERVGGCVHTQGFGQQYGVAGFVLGFSLGDDEFSVRWPVLQPKRDSDLAAARRQAATFLYHNVKAKCMEAKVLGVRHAFFAHLMIEGRPAAQFSTPQLTEHMPRMLT